MLVLVRPLDGRLLRAVLDVVVFGVLVRVGMRGSIAMPVLVLVTDVLVGMSVRRAVVLVLVGVAVRCLFHFDFIVYRLTRILRSRT
ncbi:MAG: hypothetical protein GIW94_10020 [Candidatus Eremiobacteraeota bacterium]|nr:hypothetical protein [Candidatus Eremiobacteraeota bacterium]MBC5822898.1 hypothetical protein [Candidatus Eremiobacteraeota bacterium]